MAREQINQEIKVLLDQLPIPVHAEIFQRDGYKTVVFALDEETTK